ncbi:hypothetical protein AZF06_23705 [Priestia endophytica]|uniref:PadR family transcriptional regulator n=1 Tax=Priestia endophytica DSM 13796 TaxID=1121089 RepID=A0A1I6BUY1_9BACI|nr:hypothetical protein AZF06_23705 [Priestia endophytica]MBG9811112.1 hypothetical protein [Priestia endophytica]SFQ84739.1 hypothetical protein SAMN02745910_04268 [Priestia endophytica DSM 13796]
MEIMYSQMIKGLLEESILAMIQRKDVYGYELLETLQKGGFKKGSGLIRVCHKKGLKFNPLSPFNSPFFYCIHIYSLHILK